MPDDDVTPDEPTAPDADAAEPEAPAAEGDAPAAEADAPAAEPEPEPNPVHDEIGVLLQGAGLASDAVIQTESAFDTLVVRVAPGSWRRAAEVAKESLDCDYLSFVSAIDWMPAPKEGGDEGGSDTSAPVQPTETTYGAAGSAGRFQVFAHVQSTTRHWGVTFKTDVDEQSPLVESWVPVYPGADWHERECWEMFGIVFDGHPDLRKLYLPAEFDGHPLRKDFPLLARVVKPWPGLVDVEPMPESGQEEEQSLAPVGSESGADPTGEASDA
jgi:NADH-quinone oxidoreductase subunit C